MASAHDDVTNPAMLRGLERFLGERDAGRPFFLFAYFWDPHYDYIPPEPYDGMFVEPGFEPIDVLGYEVETTVHPGIRPAQLDFVRSQYDGEIRWTDEHLGRLFEALRAAGLWEDTLVVVTADHGEEFFEHGNKGHKHNLYQESVHVPLIVKYPGEGPRGRDDRLVSLVDVLPTVLEVTRCGDVQAHEGRSLLAPPDPARPIFFELRDLWYFSRPGEPEQTAERQWFAVREGDEKLIVLPAERRLELYDLKVDPGETRNVGPEREPQVRELLERLERWRSAQQELAALLPAQGQAELSQDLLQRLRSLGYLR